MIGYRVSVAALAVLACPSLAHAEDWHYIGTSQSGNIIEIDRDSIRQAGTGIWSDVSAGGQKAVRFYFDCNGHYSDGQTLDRIPKTSLAEAMQQYLCFYAAPKKPGQRKSIE